MLLASDGRFTRWMLKVSFFMMSYIKGYIWRKPLVLWQIPTLFVDIRSYCMVWIDPPWAWYEKIHHFFVNLGLQHCEFDHSIYVLDVNGDTLIIVIYVDDLVLIGKNIDVIFILKSQLVDTFEMIDLGMLHFFLCLQVLPLLYGLFTSHSKYVLDLLKCFKMDECKACVIPFQSGVKLIKDHESL